MMSSKHVISSAGFQPALRPIQPERRVGLWREMPLHNFYCMRIKLHLGILNILFQVRH